MSPDATAPSTPRSARNATSDAAAHPTARNPTSDATVPSAHPAGRDRRSGWVRVLARAASPVAPRLALAILAGMAAAGAGVGLMATSAWLISRAATRPPVLHLMVAIVAVRAFGLSRGFLRYCERLVGHDAALRVLAGLRVRYYAQLARLAPAGLRGYRRGDLVERLVRDVDAVLDVLVRVIIPYAVALGVAIASVVLVGVLLFPAGVALAVALALATVVVPIVQSAMTRRADARLAPLRGELAAQTVDVLHGLADLTAYGAVDERLLRVAQVDDRLRAVTASSSGTTGIGTAVTTALAGGCAVAALAAGTVAVEAGTLAGELLAVVVLTPLAVFEAISGLPVAASRLGSARAALARVAAVLSTPDPTPEPAPSPPPNGQDPTTTHGQDPATTRGQRLDTTDVPRADVVGGPRSIISDGPHVVALRGVSAEWVPGRPALRSVDLELRPRQRVALVGASGSGKSTVAALLVRFLDPTEGSVTIDGVDVRDLPSDEVRRIVVLCDDDAYLFDSTIEANLRIGRPGATTEELHAALAAARLLEWVHTLPNGLATAVGEHGVKLSGGQRRRLALARALLADPAVLVLDEPTEHLDDEAAAAVMRDLLAATTGRTTLIITHRTAELSELDEIVTLDGGLVTRRRPAVATG